MKQNKKTFYKLKLNNLKQNSHFKNLNFSQNSFMMKNDNDNYTLHIMPPQITDDDITALFNGVVNVVKKKIELETKAEIINQNVNIEKLLKALKEKEAECIRLKNEILFLQNQLAKQAKNT